MPSIIPGYEYDIFISYRQKDNKYDGWVTEFVSNLKKECEATFKEDVSIYFDENPHDGLRETHDVDKSLENKLRCAIFIPILSQTYCDPKSFAWKNEFLVFKKLASADPVGLDVRLTSGNVTKRILPIKIHDLDPTDRQTLEKEIGVVRSIDFIFRNTGVNRPLRANESRENENLNKTYYRDQINKVANTVKEIISSMKGGDRTDVNPTEPPSRVQTGQNKRVGYFYLAIAAVMAILALFVWFNPFDEEKGKNASVAILPFRNNTGAPELDYYGVGMASEIRTKLSVSKQFSFVSSLQATLPYRETNKSTSEIGDELNVEFIISGLYQKSGDRIKVEAELVQASTGQVMWTVSFERTLDDVFDIQTEIAREIINRLAQDKPKTKEWNMTTNIAAYAHYTRGRQLLDNTYGDSARAIDSYRAVLQQFEKAIQLDSSFVDAWAELISVEAFIWMQDEDGHHLAREQKIREYYRSFDKRFPDSWQKKLVQGQIAYRVDFDYDKAIELFEGVLHENPDNVHAVYALSSIYKRKFNFEAALKYGARLINLNPAHGGNWINLGHILEFMGDSKNAFKSYLKGWQLSKSKNFAQGLTYHAVIGNISTDDLPEDLKKNDGGYPFWSRVAKRDWQGLKKNARAKKEFFELALASLALDERDSVVYFAGRMKLPTRADSMLHFALLGNHQKIAELEKRFDADQKEMKDDRMVAAIDFATDIDLLMMSNAFEQATTRLKELNSKYPEFGNYDRFRNNPEYDRIRKQHRPFDQALANIKVRSIANVNDYVKLE
jgi:TolB-like protein